MFDPRIPLIFALLAAVLWSVPYRTVALAAVPENSAPPADPQITAALADISAQRVQANIEKLVSFQTRMTLSAQDPDSIKAGHGIGAAREWIKEEFESYSRACGGCLAVKTDSFTENPADRIPKPTVITNVYAVLKGTDPENAKRIVLVTGHYDSRNSDTLDASGIAPGANDDGSGTAVSLECARVLSQLKFPATIVFLTVAGEEQGLNGSHHFAKMAKEQGLSLNPSKLSGMCGRLKPYELARCNPGHTPRNPLEIHR
jgi:acetylornithine deacetylase/succinyl-diaminopimelate desuccinylase-like protein